MVEPFECDGSHRAIVGRRGFVSHGAGRTGVYGLVVTLLGSGGLFGSKIIGLMANVSLELDGMAAHRWN